MSRTLEANDIILNMNMLPHEPLSNHDRPDGIRIGVQEMTRFGMGEPEMGRIAELIHECIVGKKDVKEEVNRFRSQFREVRYSYDNFGERKAEPLKLDEIRSGPSSPDGLVNDTVAARPEAFPCAAAAGRLPRACSGGRTPSRSSSASSGLGPFTLGGRPVRASPPCSSGPGRRPSGQRLRPAPGQLRPLLINSLLFTVQLSLVYVGFTMTSASRGALITNLQPFFLLFLAHFFLAGDRITLLKLIGLVLGFAGRGLRLAGPRGRRAATSWPGDLLLLGRHRHLGRQRRLHQAPRPEHLVGSDRVLPAALFDPAVCPGRAAVGRAHGRAGSTSGSWPPSPSRWCSRPPSRSSPGPG
ncbi:MAG: EamA family transporter [Candidatus Moduliflexus flocculans]|nr:EamA family transporter [Candidatus Moduliflexus flocculans]